MSFTCFSYAIRISFICQSYVLVCNGMSLVHTRMSSVCHSYVLVCHPYVTRMYWYVLCMSSVCHSYVFVCHLYVIRMYSYIIRMLLVCTRMTSVCHSYVLVCHPYVTRMLVYHEPFRGGTFSQLHLLSTATLSICQLVIKGVLHQLQEFFLVNRLLPKSCNICIVYLIQWLHKVLSNSYFFE